MTGWLADRTLAHLRDVADWPDLGERYEVTGRLGRGGMGAVYAAYDRSLDRDVAVKVLDAADCEEGAAARLMNEATILARLEHPGSVPVHDAGTLRGGRVFYVMKLVRGACLRDEIATATHSTPQRLDTFLRVCEAVSFAHSHGIVHCDLKPENIMLGPFGEVLVMDWGVAVSLGAARRSESVVVGTPGFMAPEQEKGDTAIDRAAFWMFAVGGFAFTAVFLAAGAISVPRRWAVHLEPWLGLVKLGAVFALVVVVGVVVFVSRFLSRARAVAG